MQKEVFITFAIGVDGIVDRTAHMEKEDLLSQSRHPLIYTIAYQ